jgi:excisionase family DNA binding protein
MPTVQKAATTASPRPPLTVQQAARELALSVYTLRAWIASRRVAYIRLGRTIRIPHEEVDRLLDAGFVPAERRR